MSPKAPAKSKTKPRKLKVYEAQIGFYDTVVAAPNMTAALRAWGTHRNLFADGEAAEATDQQAIEAALAQPETPLRRGVGTGEPFGLKPHLPSLPDLPGPKAEASPPKREAAERLAAKAPLKQPPADRTALTAAEAAVDAVEADRRREEKTLDRRRAELDEEEAVARRRLEAVRLDAEAVLKRERKAFVAAGGKLPGAR